jgi:hypothetical protein
VPIGHAVGRFDADHCQACAVEAGLMGHADEPAPGG